jgi:hypothetical protein
MGGGSHRGGVGGGGEGKGTGGGGELVELEKGCHYVCWRSYSVRSGQMRCIFDGQARAEGGQGWVEQGGEGGEASGEREGSGLGWEEKLQSLQTVHILKSTLYSAPSYCKCTRTQTFQNWCLEVAQRFVGRDESA